MKQSQSRRNFSGNKTRWAPENHEHVWPVAERYPIQAQHWLGAGTNQVWNEYTDYGTSVGNGLVEPNPYSASALLQLTRHAPRSGMFDLGEIYFRAHELQEFSFRTRWGSTDSAASMSVGAMKIAVDVDGGIKAIYRPETVDIDVDIPLSSALGDLITWDCWMDRDATVINNRVWVQSEWPVAPVSHEWEVPQSYSGLGLDQWKTWQGVFLCWGAGWTCGLTCHRDYTNYNLFGF